MHDAFRQWFSSAHRRRRRRRRSWSIEWSRQTDLVAVGDELLQGAHLLVDPVPSPLQRTHAGSKIGQPSVRWHWQWQWQACQCHACANERIGSQRHACIEAEGNGAGVPSPTGCAPRRCGYAWRSAPPTFSSRRARRPCPAEQRGGRSDQAGFGSDQWERCSGWRAWSGMVCIATSSGLTEQSAARWLLLLSWLRSPLPEQTEEAVTAAASGGLASGCERG